MTTIRDRLVAAFANGTLLQTIADLTDGRLSDDGDTVACQVADAHNAGLIDAVAAFRDLKNSRGYDFWLVQNVFEEALPKLSAPVLEVMKCCDALVKEGGNDGAAGGILNSYANFLAKNSSRYEQALK